MKTELASTSSQTSDIESTARAGGAGKGARLRALRNQVRIMHAFRLHALVY
jgi:hypothetical protein